MKTKYHPIQLAAASDRPAPALKSKYAIRLRPASAALGGILFASVCALMPSSVEAQRPSTSGGGGTAVLSNTTFPTPSSVAVPSSTPSPARIPKHTGKAKSPAGAPVPTPPPQAPSAQGVPGITASPHVVTVPAGQTQGKTTLTWDGGKDHPYAEVWVKEDDQDEKFVVEKGKGTRAMTVEPGKTYLYILTDSGQRLATVTVKGKQ